MATGRLKSTVLFEMHYGYSSTTVQFYSLSKMHVSVLDPFVMFLKVSLRGCQGGVSQKQTLKGWFMASDEARGDLTARKV